MKPLFLLLIAAVLNAHSALIASYSFSGNATDESGNGNDGIVYGATLTTDRFGNANSAYEFDGNGQYLVLSGFAANKRKHPRT
jgi:hypothetical protein